MRFTVVSFLSLSLFGKWPKVRWIHGGRNAHFFSKINGATYWKRYRRRRSRKKENATRKGINSYRILLWQPCALFLSFSLLRTWSSMSCPPLLLKYQMELSIVLKRRKSHNACQIGRLDQWLNGSSRLDSQTDWLPIQSRRRFVGDQPGFIYSACLDTSPLHRLLLLLQVLTLSFLLLHFLLWTKACRSEKERA